MPKTTRTATEGFHNDKLARTARRRRRLRADCETGRAADAPPRNDLRPTLEVVETPTASVNPSPHRARKTNPEQLQRVIDSIRTFGISMPILVASDGEIIDGHIVHAAAVTLGLATVPVINCRHLSETEVRQLRLAMNRIGELGEWDEELLKLEFEELIALDVDLEVTGFSLTDQDIILLDDDPSDEGDNEELEADRNATPVSRVGDLWDLTPHRLICADSRDDATYQLLLGNEQVAAVIADNPYNVRIVNNVSGLGAKKHGEFVCASGEMSPSEFEELLTVVKCVIVAYLVNGGVFFSFMDWRSFDLVYRSARSAGLNVINLVVWSKQVGAMGALYRSAHELIVVLCKGDSPRVNNVKLGAKGRDRTNVWSAPGANQRGSSANEMLKEHSTPKPTELCVDAILDVTNRGDTVLDPFMGSGTTLIAAHRAGRRCVGVELDPKYVDVAVRRWQRETGKLAILAGTSQTFAEVEIERLSEQAAEDRPGPDVDDKESLA